ncbi:hypothetical protein EV702DRAFT_1202739 [Suillus placidus]|uniref:Uncharacterized protein n=1 Tax=Suillus placidus TaxID=48579 RepID=A0A9P6ZKL0_9AGAM|nr:hypothetical protein EV702DRAFT_1202739 [Suillus placidus]
MRTIETVSQLTAGKTPDDIRVDVTKQILHDHSVRWFVETFKLINKPDIVVKAFSLCTAGADNTFNLSFDSLTSVEAHCMLRDLPQTAPDMWEHIQSRRQPASEDPAVPALVSEDTIDKDDNEPHQQTTKPYTDFGFSHRFPQILTDSHSVTDITESQDPRVTESQSATDPQKLTF